MIRPVLTLIAGANGAGKSTLSSGNPEIFSSVPLLDPDRFTRPLTPSAASPIAAGREVLGLAKDYLEKGKSFSVESTLSGRNYLEMMSRARSLGFEVVLICIGTEDIRINLSRIQQRVLGEAIMFRRLMFGDGTSAASTISRWLCSVRITHCSSTTQPN